MNTALCNISSAGDAFIRSSQPSSVLKRGKIKTGWELLIEILHI